MLLHKGRITLWNGFKATSQFTLRWGDYSGLSEWAQCYHKGSHVWKRETRNQSQIKIKDAVLKMEEGAIAQECWQAREAREDMEIQSVLKPPKGIQPCWPLDFCPMTPIWDF